jgi:hypothetical protein
MESCHLLTKNANLVIWNLYVEVCNTNGLKRYKISWNTKERLLCIKYTGIYRDTRSVVISAVNGLFRSNRVWCLDCKTLLMLCTLCTCPPFPPFNLNSCIFIFKDLQEISTEVYPHIYNTLTTIGCVLRSTFSIPQFKWRWMNIQILDSQPTSLSEVITHQHIYINGYLPIKYQLGA